MSSRAAREPAAPLIELRDVHKSYAGLTPVHVLRDVSLEIYAGEFVAIMGSSGSGKSTLMNLLGCLDRPSSGSYRFAGREVSSLASDELARMRRETFGFVFQQYHLVPGLTAAENTEVPAVYRGLSRPERQTRAAQLLMRLGLVDRSHHRPDQLSGGQQQRVSIARALMNGGRVLLADEPTGALDRTSGQEVMQLLRQLSAAGHTIILVTHDRAVAREARRTIELSDGRIVADSGRDRGGVSAFESRADSARNISSWRGGIQEAVRTALRALRVNVVRSLLTLLGIVVGVASVVALLAIGEGTKRSILQEMTAFGAHRLYVSPNNEDPRNLSAGLTAADAALIAQVPRVAAAMPSTVGRVMVRYGNVDHSSTVLAVTRDFPRILNWKIDRGSYFDAADERSLATVALLGPKLAKILFPGGQDPLRQFVLVENVPFQVIGVLASKGALSGDKDDDDALIIPFATGSQRVFGTPYASWISVAMQDSAHAPQTIAKIERVLTDARRIQDFHVFNMAGVVAARSAMLDTMTTLLLVTAIISLVVGGIGVMNIMLMTVAERTSEIGIRVAVGARGRDVLTQFLTEAVVLASMGGVLGLGLGWGAGLAGQAFDMKVAFTVPASALAFCCAVATGLLSGILPARRAALLDPVVALARA